MRKRFRGPVPVHYQNKDEDHVQMYAGIGRKEGEAGVAKAGGEKGEEGR